MMQTAEPWHRDNPTTQSGLAHCLTTGRRSLCQSEMRSVVVIIAHVLKHEAFQMPLVENDHMVEQISAAASDIADMVNMT